MSSSMTQRRIMAAEDHRIIMARPTICSVAALTQVRASMFRGVSRGEIERTLRFLSLGPNRGGSSGGHAPRAVPTDCLAATFAPLDLSKSMQRCLMACCERTVASPLRAA